MAKLIVDFTKAESGGRVRIPEGDYRAEVTGVKAGESKAGNQMLIWEFTISDGKHKGKKFKDYTTLNVEAAWKLKGILENLGLSVPMKRLDITPLIRKVKGKELGITVTDDEYEGKISSKISDYIDLETLEEVDTEDEEDEDEDEEEEEKPKAKKKKGKKKKKEEDEDEIEDMDLDDIG